MWVTVIRSSHSPLPPSAQRIRRFWTVMSATRKLITDIASKGRYSQDNSSGGYCVRFAHSSDIFPDVDDLRGAAWLRHLYSCSEISPCHIDLRCRIGTSSSTF